MSTRGTDTLNVQGLNTRKLQFNQTAPNPQTTNTGNPFGNTIRLRFPYPQSFTNCDIALADLTLFYSWYNITAAFGNNTFTYSYPQGSGYTTYTVTIPDGFYTIDQLNAFFEQIQLANGTYTVDSAGNITYYLYWVTNSTYYRTTLFANPVPTAAQLATTGAVPPSTSPVASPTVSVTPYLTILPTVNGAGTVTPGFYSFSKTLGFTPGNYPTATTTTSVSLNGQFAPVIESTNVVNVACNLVNQGTVSPYVNVFYTFSPTVPFGEQITIAPPWPQFCPVSAGFYNFVDFTLFDENLVPLNLQDPHISGSVIIRGT